MGDLRALLPSPSGASTDHRYYLLWRSVGAPDGVGEGGGGELVNPPSAKKFWHTFRAKADCALIVLPLQSLPFCHL